MELYFLRHADAQSREEWKGDDTLRPLSKEGMARMHREAKALAGLSLGVSLILSSPLERAVQTATITAEALGLIDSLIIEPRLAPGFAVEALRVLIAEHAEVGAMMLIGHEPDFSATIAACIGGGQVECKKGGLARLSVTEPLSARATLVWLLPPRMLAP